MYTFGVYLVYHTHMYDILTLSKAALCDTSKEVELSENRTAFGDTSREEELFENMSLLICMCTCMLVKVITTSHYLTYSRRH